MRRLVACEDCHRQYDGTGLAVGDRFRCHCGSTVAVSSEPSHEAAVVRCSSCGGARRDGAPACSFCGADFTIHEQDLHTVCPDCLTRISDKAKFCHSCGVEIAVIGGIGEAVERPCPSCEGEKPLYHRQLGDRKTPFFECHACAGFWICPDSFRSLADEARAKSLPPELTGLSGDPNPDPAPLPTPGRMYRRCPDCTELMHRKNFGTRSGVVIDLCKRHGVWFDDGELVRILNWIRDGGEALVAKRAAQAKRESSVDRFHKNQIERMARQGGYAGRTSDTLRGGTLLGEVLTEGAGDVLFSVLDSLFD